MRARQLVAMFGMSVALAGCGDSSLNPFSWFSSGPEVETLSEIEFDQVIDARPLIDTITNLTVERIPGGAIVRATGLPRSQGWQTADLVSEDSEGEPVDGVLGFTFRAIPPEETTRASTVQSREIVAAVYVSDITLARVREIRVTGASNARTARR